jgi:AcrR family transcriptional regulator
MAIRPQDPGREARADAGRRAGSAPRGCSAQHGYAATSLEQIAADAGTTIRPVYHYFGNKQALFEAVA